MINSPDEVKDDLAVKIIDTALYILQTRQFTAEQQTILIQFLQNNVGVDNQTAEQVLLNELHPKHRNVLSFVEKKAFESALFKKASLLQLQEATNDDDLPEQMTEIYESTWSPETSTS